MSRKSFVLLVFALAACSGEEESRGRDGAAAGGQWAGFGEEAAAAVPVEVAVAQRRTIGSFLETNGTLEAENEVDLVARVAGPLIELAAEENQEVATGQRLARVDPAPARAALEVADVELRDATAAFERVEALRAASLISAEGYDQAQTRLAAAEAQAAERRLELEHTEVRAPFSGLIVRRYVKFAETVSVGQPLFRLSDFIPLLCPIQVPERELSRLRVGQPAEITVDAWPEQRFSASVLRISPVVDAATGTVRVTLEVDGRDQLRPGMFASVFVETESRENALVIPYSALVLDSVRDAVFVVDGDRAVRREIVLGVRQGDVVEVVQGLDAGDRVVSIGQDALSDGMEVRILAADGTPEEAEGGAEAAPTGPPDEARLEEMRRRMKERGLSDEQIEERIRQVRRSGTDG